MGRRHRPRACRQRCGSKHPHAEGVSRLSRDDAWFADQGRIGLELVDRPVSDRLQRASGWGALEVRRRTSTGELRLLGGMARGRPVLATVLITTGVVALAIPGSSAFAAEFLVLNGIFTIGWGWAVVGAVLTARTFTWE